MRCRLLSRWEDFQPWGTFIFLSSSTSARRVAFLIAGFKLISRLNNWYYRRIDFCRLKWYLKLMLNAILTPPWPAAAAAGIRKTALLLISSCQKGYCVTQMRRNSSSVCLVIATVSFAGGGGCCLSRSPSGSNEYIVITTKVESVFL